MRSRLNKVKWKVKHINITINLEIDSYISSSKKHTMTRDEFFSEVIKYLDSEGFLPLYPIEVMKEKLHSPYSESEYYTFLKCNNNDYVKVVLDIRLTGHYHDTKKKRKYSERDRHIYYMDNVAIPGIGQQLNKDASNTSSEFIDISDHIIGPAILIDADGKMFTTYDEALVEVESKIDAVS